MRQDKKTWQEIGDLMGVDERTARRRANGDLGAGSGPLSFFFLSDVHIPRHDERLLLHAINLIDQLKPDVTIIGGDWYDAESVSSYPKNAHRVPDLENDLGQAKPFEEAIKQCSKKVVFMEGNHEDRLRRYLASQAPAVQGLLKPAQVFFPGHDEYIPYDSHYRPLPYLTFVHGRFVRKNALASIRAHYDELGGSVVCGHVHRHASCYGTVGGRDHFLIENGHCQHPAKVPYAHGAWQQSAGVYVESDMTGDHLSFLDFPVVNGRCRGIRI
jgi:predicted phosphodiesterase